LTRGVEFLPVRQHRLARYRVHEARSQLCQRPQYEAVFQYVAARYPHRALIDHPVIVQQQIDIERTCCPFIVAAIASCQIM